MEIRNYIYLDTLKLHSYSSQIFKGLTKETSKVISEGEINEIVQKLGGASGRGEKDIINEKIESIENKVAHDNLYNELEHKMAELGKIVNINNVSEEEIQSLSSLSVIKLKSKVKFYNHESTKEFLTNLKDFMKALQKLNPQEKLETIPEDMRKSTLTILERSMVKDTLEIGMEKLGYKITSLLKNEFLKETPEVLTQKIGVTNSEIELTLVGTVTQSLKVKEEVKFKNSDDQLFREAFNLVVESLNLVDNTLKSKSENEIIIDPIAIYYEF